MRTTYQDVRPSRRGLVGWIEAFAACLVVVASLVVVALRLSYDWLGQLLHFVNNFWEDLLILFFGSLILTLLRRILWHLVLLIFQVAFWSNWIALRCLLLSVQGMVCVCVKFLCVCVCLVLLFYCAGSPEEETLWMHVSYVHNVLVSPHVIELTAVRTLYPLFLYTIGVCCTPSNLPIFSCTMTCHFFSDMVSLKSRFSTGSCSLEVSFNVLNVMFLWNEVSLSSCYPVPSFSLPLQMNRNMTRITLAY